jgi:hypothetical protein
MYTTHCLRVGAPVQHAATFTCKKAQLPSFTNAGKENNENRSAFVTSGGQSTKRHGQLQIEPALLESTQRVHPVLLLVYTFDIVEC